MFRVYHTYLRYFISVISSQFMPTYYNISPWFRTCPLIIAYFWLILLFLQSMYIHINYIVFLVNYVSVLICCYNKIKI